MASGRFFCEGYDADDEGDQAVAAHVPDLEASSSLILDAAQDPDDLVPHTSLK
jgi:hypothetical protein